MNRLETITIELSDAVNAMTFSEPVTHIYNPFVYAREPALQYARQYGEVAPRDAILVGMNPGPWGMAQTGVPFGEIDYVRNWLKIDGKVDRPPVENPKRPIEGFACERSEVSGRRLWTWAEERFRTADAFFERFFVWNYCPLVFMEESGRNFTPDKLPADERNELFAPCDEALRQVVDALKPTMVIGVGVFAEKRAKAALKDVDVEIGRILHPSPASPKANRGWQGYVEEDFAALDISLD